MNNSSSSASGRSALGGSTAGVGTASLAGGTGQGRRPAPHGASVKLNPAQPAAHPVLKWLAIGGWGTFAAEWLLMLLVLTSLAGRDGGVNAEAAPAPTVVQAPTKPRPADRPTPVATPTGPRVLGLDPGRGHTVVLLDAIERSRPWLDRAKTQLIKDLTRPGAAGATFSVAVINGDDGRGLINRPLPYGPAAAGPLRKAFKALKAKGTKGLSNGLDAANKLGADQVVFITARDSKWGGAVPFLEGKLSANGKRVRLHVVQVNDKPVNDLRAFVTGANGGTYLKVAPGSL